MVCVVFMHTIGKKPFCFPKGTQKESERIRKNQKQKKEDFKKQEGVSNACYWQKLVLPNKEKHAYCRILKA